MIEDCAIAFDVVAQPAQTPFIIAAEQAGKAIISGAEVIVLQAIEQFELYTGIRPSPELVIEATRFAHGDATAARLMAAITR
jgi:shikimate dehydrogenase